ncbi:hypothetical protein BGZ83_000192 [Gryganskiella cystojenkinii]|nr:hypothetical protein BGZ83_000192 [Gryganskiella cystojenkinii]
MDVDNPSFTPRYSEAQPVERDVSNRGSSGSSLPHPKLGLHKLWTYQIVDQRSVPEKHSKPCKVSVYGSDSIADVKDALLKTFIEPVLVDIVGDGLGRLDERRFVLRKFILFITRGRRVDFHTGRARRKRVDYYTGGTRSKCVYTRLSDLIDRFVALCTARTITDRCGDA